MAEPEDGFINEFYSPELGNVVVEANCNCKMNRFTLEIFAERSGYPQDFATLLKAYATLLEEKRTLVDMDETDLDN